MRVQVGSLYTNYKFKTETSIYWYMDVYVLLKVVSLRVVMKYVFKCYMFIINQFLNIIFTCICWNLFQSVVKIILLEFI